MSEFTVKSVFETACRDDLLDGIRLAMAAISEAHEAETERQAASLRQGRTLSQLQTELAKLISDRCPLDTGFNRHASIHDILEELLKVGGAEAISRIRFYSYNSGDEDGSYLLVDSAGYDEATASRLRNRGLVLFKSSCPLDCSESFWADRLGVPTAITVNRYASSNLEARYYPGCLPLIETPYDSCEESLSDAKSNTWIDVPLAVCGKATGKLSCDFAYAISHLTDYQKDIMRFCALAQIAAPFLEVLYQRLFLEPLNDVVADIQSCDSLERLFDYCTNRLPQLFNASNASLFTLSTDSFGASKLVLERTSFGPARQHEGEAAYSLEDDALTAWVARNIRSLRIHNLAEDREREQQLNQYRVFDSRLNWQDRLTDSRNHSSYLAVPILVDAERVGGVIRLTEKCAESDSHFTEHDQWLLNRIAREVIGPRLVHLQAARATNVMPYECLQDANTLLVSNRIPTTPAIVDATKMALRSLFPTMEGHHRSIAINILTNDCRYYQQFEVGSGKCDRISKENVHNLKSSLTDRVIQEFLQTKHVGENGHNVLFINDRANAEKRAGIHIAFKEAATAIACPIAFRSKVYGVLIIESNRYDLSQELHGHWLELIAIQAGTMFARRDHVYLSKLKSEAQSVRADDLVAWLSRLEEMFSSPTGAAKHTTLQQMNLRNTMVKVAHDVGGDRFQVSVPDVDVLTHKPPLVGVMYRTLRDLCVHSTTTNPVQIRGYVKDKWFELIVEKFFDEADPLDGTSWNVEDTDALLSCSNSDFLAWSRKLAYFTQIDCKRGSVLKDNADLVLKFPSG